MRTLLQIVTALTQELGLPVPSTVETSVDPQVIQIVALLHREGRELQQQHDWTTLQTQWIISVATPVATTGVVTKNSAVITGIPSTSGITAPYYTCTGDGIPVAARVISVDSGTQVTLDMLATGSNATASLTFAKDTYARPSDFDRFINQTGWDRTNRWALLGPDTPQEDQWHRSGIVTVGPRRHFRQIGTPPNCYRLWPPPTTTDTPFQLAQEYISQNWVLGADGVPKQSFTLDTDVTLIGDNMLILGAKWRLLQVKGMEYGPQQQEYLDYVDRRIAEDGGAKILQLSANVSPYLSPAIVRDGFFPGFTGPNMS